jgi:LemA protein
VFLKILLIVLVVGSVTGWVVIIHNRFAALSNLIAESWRQVDVELQRRHDLIPNLVQVVSGYAAHERALFEGLIAARTQALAVHTPAQLTGPETALEYGVGQALAVAEAYPELNSSTHFLRLQHELRNCEDRIAAGRRFYNGNVRALNTLKDSFPAGLLGGGTKRGEYFMLDSPAARLPLQLQFPQR